MRSRADAEDITQEVMLRMHRTELDQVERMAAWVHRVAANAIVDHYRRPARRELPAGQAIDVPELEPTDADGDGLRRELAECLTPLIERQQTRAIL